MSRLESVLMQAAAGGDLRHALHHAATAHRDPDFEARLDTRRAELATKSDAELEQLALEAGVAFGPAVGGSNGRALLVERVAVALAQEGSL